MERMTEMKKFYAIDLFAGCGGLSEGFIQAGFEVIAQIEMDRWACETLKTRHVYHELKRIKKKYLYDKYVKEEISREEILRRFYHINEAISHRVIQATLGKDKNGEILKRIEIHRKEISEYEKFAGMKANEIEDALKILTKGKTREKRELKRKIKWTVENLKDFSQKNIQFHYPKWLFLNP